MDSVGIVQLRQLVSEVAGKVNLELTIEGDPISPFRVLLGEVERKYDHPLAAHPITGWGSPTQVAAQLQQWFVGYGDGFREGVDVGTR